MRRRFSPRPSAGLVVAVVALFVALGGTAAARLIITGGNVRDGSLTGADIKDRSIGGAKIRNDSLTGTQIKESTLSTVPSAKNAEMLGGKAAGAYGPAPQWALIAGTPGGMHVLAGSGGLSAERIGAGIYLVDAGTSVTGKLLSATVHATSIALISVAPCGGSANNPGGIDCPFLNDSNHVFVRTFGPGMGVTDATFYIAIGG